jgi:hypothetical protein
MKKSVSLLMVMAVFATSCASSTMIRSDDKDAKIYVDGEYRGQGSVSHMDQKTSFETTLVRFEKPGCKGQTFHMPRGEQFQVGPFIGGLFVLVPFLWVAGYKSEHSYEYSCTKI